MTGGLRCFPASGTVIRQTRGDAVIPVEPLAHGRLFPAGSNCSILITTDLPEIARQGRWRSSG